MHALEDLKLAVIGLGYVGLPLAVEFGKIRPVVGFDLQPARIDALRVGHDNTQEVSSEELAAATKLTVTNAPSDLAGCNTYIVAVPTPIDASKRPDLGPLISASETVGALLQPGDIVIYESTVFPGATEEVCVPILERLSGLSFNTDFFAGYSPERINPGDKAHRLPDICKVTSGSTPQAARLIDALYAQIITAGTYRADSIAVAEAAKVIENTQRDLNIALVNELAMLFNRLGLDTEAVLRAAGTKWNFMPFRPGLVGGHCIGVDPYYLTHKAETVGFHPQIILAGRRINDQMGTYVAGRLVKAFLKRHMPVSGARLLVLGLTFKENCPDVRNTQVAGVIRELQDYGFEVDVHDPWVDPEEVRAAYGLSLTERPARDHYDGILLAVGHAQFTDMGADALRAYGKDPHLFFDLKSCFPAEASDVRL